MKFPMKAERFKILILGAGGLALALQRLLYSSGVDGRGLLEKGHWAAVTLWILTAGVLAAVYLFTRKLEGPADYADSHPASVSAALGALAAMVGLGVTSVQSFGEFSNQLTLLGWVLGVLSTVAFGCIGFCRLSGRKPHFLLHTGICLYFALRMVMQYRLWSFEPQLIDYCFYLCAYVFLMLASYQQAAFDADIGNHKAAWFSGLISFYLCCLSLKGTPDTCLMLGCGIWVFTNLPKLHIRRRRQRPALHPDAESAAEE